MNHSTIKAKGFTSVTTCCIFLGLLSSLSIVGANEVSGTHSLLQAHRLGHTGNVDHRSENSLKTIPLDGILNRQNEKEDGNAQWDNDVAERVKRAAQSGYIRFGKRDSSDSAENDLTSGVDSTEYEEQRYAPEADEAFFPRFLRAPDSSYVRFGKRGPPVGLSYSGCVAYTLARARNRKDLVKMLVENGCVKEKRILRSNYAKKDGYIRFGKK